MIAYGLMLIHVARQHSNGRPQNYAGLENKDWRTKNLSMSAVFPSYRRYNDLPPQNTFAVNPPKSKTQTLLKLRVYLQINRVHVRPDIENNDLIISLRWREMTK